LEKYILHDTCYANKPGLVQESIDSRLGLIKKNSNDKDINDDGGYNNNNNNNNNDNDSVYGRCNNNNSNNCEQQR